MQRVKSVRDDGIDPTILLTHRADVGTYIEWYHCWYSIRSNESDKTAIASRDYGWVPCSRYLYIWDSELNDTKQILVHNLSYHNYKRAALQETRFNCVLELKWCCLKYFFNTFCIACWTLQNMNAGEGLVNGARGVVTGFVNGLPIVKVNISLYIQSSSAHIDI